MSLKTIYTFIVKFSLEILIQVGIYSLTQIIFPLHKFDGSFFKLPKVSFLIMFCVV